MEGNLKMSLKERERLKLFARVKLGELQQKQAAEICGLDYRQTRRLYQRYCAQGDRGLVHRGRGRPSNQRYALEFRELVLARFIEISRLPIQALSIRMWATMFPPSSATAIFIWLPNFLRFVLRRADHAPRII
jgi:hypothetical protein